MISFTKGYSNPRHFGEIVEVLSPDEPTPPTTNVTPSASATAITVPTLSLAQQGLFWNPENPEPFVERMVLYLGVPTLAWAAITSRHLVTGCLLGALGAGLVYIHLNGSLAQD